MCHPKTATLYVLVNDGQFFAEIELPRIDRANVFKGMNEMLRLSAPPKVIQTIFVKTNSFYTTYADSIWPSVAGHKLIVVALRNVINYLAIDYGVYAQALSGKNYRNQWCTEILCEDD